MPEHLGPIIVGGSADLPHACLPGGIAGYGDISVRGASVKTNDTDWFEQTSAAETVHRLIPIPANYLSRQNVLRWRLFGLTDNGATAITFTPRFRWGNETNLTDRANVTPNLATIVTPASSQTGKFWRIVLDMFCGSYGSDVAFKPWHERTSNAIGAQTDISCGQDGVLTIDTTAATDLVFTWQMSSITGSPKVTTYASTLEIIGL